jgi:hypothetical protein
MHAMAGGDFRQSIGAEGPDGLASEPPDYRRCFAAAKLVGPRSFFNQLRLTRAQVEATCHRLHSAVKAQALSYLIAVQWVMAEAASRGVAMSEADLRQALGRLRNRFSPSRHAMLNYLTERHWSLADLLYRLKAETLAAKISLQAAKQLSALGNGEVVGTALALERHRELAAKTKCAHGFVVAGCSEYRGSSASPSAPDVILKELVGKRTRGRS